jgi:DNA-binding SARP family transcriptional activator
MERGLDGYLETWMEMPARAGPGGPEDSRAAGIPEGAGVDFRLLGPVGLWHEGGGRASLGRAELPKVRCLLAVLLRSPGDLVTTEALSRRVWGDDAPGPAVRYKYAGWLRAGLAPYGIPLLQRDGGYLLPVPAEQVDLHRFRGRLKQGSRAIAERSFGQAATVLTEALAEWRGEALTGLPGGWAEQFRQQLGSERGQAEKLRFQAELENGPTEEQIERFAAWHAESTPDSQATVLLMMALQRAGSPDRAVAACRAAAARMREAYGVDLDDETRRLLRRIQARDPSLPRDPSRGARNAAPPRPGRGGPDTPDGAPAPSAGPWRLQVGSVPPAADGFQSRAAFPGPLELADSGAAGPPCWILSGLGGVGKTQITVDIARRLRDSGEAALLVWISAESRQAITGGYARALQEITGGPDPDAEAAARKFLDWLSATGHSWLIVLDNLADPGSVSELWPPETATGRVVVTTRRRDAALAGGRRRLIHVGPFTAAEARSYLAAKLASRPDLADGADQLAADLDYLPLALAQATAYLLDRELSCAGYRHRLAARRLADVLPESSSLPDDQRDSVAATWLLSVERANGLRPAGLARPVLELTSVLDPNGIPERVFTAAGATGYLSATLPGAGAVTGDDSRDALRCLQRLSMVTLQPADHGTVIRVHALVQRATRDHLTAAELARAVRACADALAGSWPAPGRQASLARSLLASAIALTAHDRGELCDGGTHPLLTRIGRSLGEAGSFRAADEHFGQLRATAAAILGAQHRDTLQAAQEQAYWRGMGGNPAGAAALGTELVADCSRALGPAHPDTLTARMYLARWHGQGGDPARAVAELSALVPELAGVLGADHEDTLTARSDLATFRAQAGDPGAVRAFTELLADRQRLLGADHHHTLISRNNLADAIGRGGEPGRALRTFTELLPDMIRVLGSQHPHTLGTRGNVARYAGEAGDPARAVRELAELTSQMEQVLGSHHPMTVRSVELLREWRERAVLAAAPPSAARPG